jgi:aspartyl-tRNA(Asn)/glutamyl-tRNA(Gln) amidotransferase subunit B
MMMPETPPDSAATLQGYEPVIGLEVHVQLKTNTKLFCGCSTQFGAPPNANTCPVCLGLPGVLPVLNEKALEYAIQIGLALDCQIATLTKFDRKQYFYPDLPKGYQISQYDKPICYDGHLTLPNGRRVSILRAHMEEDAGKLVHAGADGLHGADYSLVDLNRAGTPLVEIVSAPDIRSAEEARAYVTQIRNLVRYLGACDGNLEEGSLRCDANVSIRPVGSAQLGTKAEIKNMNSFRAIQRAVESEIARQVDVVTSGGVVVQESRLWNDATGQTAPMRSKEEAHDYRYFPEPDLKPLLVPGAWVAQLRETLPQLPQHREEKFRTQYGLSEYDTGVLVEFKPLGDFFEAAATQLPPAAYKATANWLMGDITAYLKNEKLELQATQLSPGGLASFVQMVEAGQLSSAQAKKLLPVLLAEGGDAAQQAQALGLVQISDDTALSTLIAQVLADHPKQLADYRSGKDKLFGFFVGQVMKATQGNANPERLNALLKQALET